jgi:ferredoxin--NADP+ reductase
MDLHKVIGLRNLNDSLYVLRMERKGLQFIPGQSITVGLPDDEDRPYSIYSGSFDPYIEILVKEIEVGNISRKLRVLNNGETLVIGQPYGSFTLEEEIKAKMPFWLIATGSGISPFHCFTRSYSGIDYILIHGIRHAHETFSNEFESSVKYISCSSLDNLGRYTGRVTDYLGKTEIDKKAFYYICGGYQMIDDVYDLLVSKGINKDQIKTEGYF